MAVVLIEGFDHFTNLQLTTKGWSVNPQTAMSAGRLAGQALPLKSSGASPEITSKTLPSSYTTIIVGFAVKLPTATSQNLIELRSGASRIAGVNANGTGKLIVFNSGGTTIATGTTTLLPNTWYYVELKIFVSGASGTCELHLNGATEIASTVGNFGSTNIDTLTLFGDGGGTTHNFDDVYAVDTTGAAPRNTFLGDVRVSTIMPNADGAHTQWTPDTGVVHFSRVNETTPDGDTSYVSDATVGDIDTLKVASLPSLSGTVFAVQTNLYARKDDAAVRQIALVVRQAGADNVGATVTLGTSYQFFSEIRNQDPTPADWTISNVNNDEYGAKVIA